MSSTPPAPKAKTPTAGAPVGARLREQRDLIGLSLRELARRIEVSPSLVSQIETGKIQPSVRTLYAIVNELGLSLDEIFDLSGSGGTARSAPVRRKRAQKGRATPGTSAGHVQRSHEHLAIELESGVRWERLTAWNDHDIEFLQAIYEPGGASSSDGKLVRHNGREFGFVQSGTLGVTVGFEEYVLGPGDSISFESTIPHCLHNNGNEVVRAIWVTVGRYQNDEAFINP